MASLDWQAHLSTVLDIDMLALRPVGGGDSAQSYRASLADGRHIFVKTHRQPPPGFFSTEAAGLAWLHEAKAVRVPTVLGVSDDPPWLALEWIALGGPPATRSGGSRGRAEAEFGRALSRLHGAGSAAFGRADGRTTGSLAVPNPAVDRWDDFYADCRLRPLARMAAERHALDTPVITAIEWLADRLTDLGAADEAAARLHGDLWAGNRVIDGQGRSWILDPAAHGGHREFDLAMMRLFGGFDEAVFAAYDEATPLAPGWQARVPLHQLAPLIVHAIKFGGGYRRGVRDALARLV